MVGTAGLAAAVAAWGFWVLLILGWGVGELRARGSSMFLLLWFAGFLVIRPSTYGLFFAPFVAALDIALVFVIFKGDVRLT